MSARPDPPLHDGPGLDDATDEPVACLSHSLAHNLSFRICACPRPAQGVPGLCLDCVQLSRCSSWAVPHVSGVRGHTHELASG
jgi:hypothetical protein